MTRLLLTIGLMTGAGLGYECSGDSSSDTTSEGVVVYEQSEIGSPHATASRLR